MMPDELGSGESDSLPERFLLGELLGSGGSASVFEAVDTRDGRAVAVKVLHPHLLGDADACLAFIAEARALGAVHCPNVVGLIATNMAAAAATDTSSDGLSAVGLVASGSRPWLAMERAAGVSLAELVERDGPLPLAGALAVGVGIARALVAVHGAGLVHRDVSPGNVIVDMGGVGVGVGSIVAEGVRLVDFGIAARNAEAASHLILGNPGYVSPEQAAGGAVDARGDLYQLGGVVYFALTGCPPFARASAERLDAETAVAQTLEAHRSAPPPVPSVVRAGLPRAVDRLVVRALVKHPDGRFADAAEMLAALEAAAQATAEAEGDRAGEVTAVLGAAGVDGTRVLPGVSSPRPRASSGRAAPRRRAGPAAGGWFAALLVVALVASAWFLAAAGPAPAPAPPSTSPSESIEAPPPTTPPAADFGRVPAVEGLALADAQASLERAGFVVGALTVQDATVPGDTVLALSPGAGAWIVWGSAVDLVVASGSNRVPTVLGLTEADAVAALAAAGFGAEVRRSAAASASAMVIECLPGEGSVLRLGQEVVVVVSPPAEQGPSGSPSAPPEGTPEPSGPSNPSSSPPGARGQAER